jgi:hypothetical protein
MVKEIQIIKVQLDGDDGIIVTFSDGTTTGYVVEELLELNPHREPPIDEIVEGGRDCGGSSSGSDLEQLPPLFGDMDGHGPAARP